MFNNDANSADIFISTETIISLKLIYVFVSLFYFKSLYFILTYSPTYFFRHLCSRGSIVLKKVAMCHLALHLKARSATTTILLEAFNTLYWHYKIKA